jgi:hypothetical protein
MRHKHWEADIGGVIFTAPTLKKLAEKLEIKSSLIEGAYYRKRLEDKIKIKKVEEPKPRFICHEFKPGENIVRFD